MVPVAGGLADQVLTAMQHCQSVAVAIKSSAESAALGYTVYVSESAGADAAEMVQSIVEECILSRSIPGRKVPGPLASSTASSGGEKACSEAGSGSEAGSEDRTDALDVYLQPPRVSQPPSPAAVYLTVPALPRGCFVEVQPLLVDVTSSVFETPSSSSSDDEGHKIRAQSSRNDAATSVSGGSDQPRSADWVHAATYGRKVGRFLAALPSCEDHLNPTALEPLFGDIARAGFNAQNVFSLRMWHQQTGCSSKLAASFMEQARAISGNSVWHDKQTVQVVPVCELATSFTAGSCGVVIEALASGL